MSFLFFRTNTTISFADSYAKKKQTKIKFKTGSYACSIAYFIFSHMLIGREPFQKGRLYLVKNVFAIIWPS